MTKYLKALPFCFLLLSGSSLAEEVTDDTAANTAATSAAQPSTLIIPRTEPDIDQAIIQDLSNNIPLDTELVLLDTSKSGEKLLAYYQADSSGELQGAILMFPDDKTHLDWPGDFNYLRQGLTEYGWHSLALYLPQIPAAATPKRTLPVLTSVAPAQPASSAQATEDTTAEATSEDGNATEPETSATEDSPPKATEKPEEVKQEKEPYYEQTLRRGQAGYSYLEQQEAEKFIVMGVGTGALWAAKYVEQFQDSQELTLIIIDAQQPKSISSPNLLQVLPEITTTIIDFYHGNRLSMEGGNPVSAKRRLTTAKRAELTEYHQIRLPEVRDNWKKTNPWLLKYVRGAINTYLIQAEEAVDEQPPKQAQDKMEKAPGAKAI